MIDFTGCKVLVNSYEGADFKRKIIYDGDVYMLKFGQKLESDEHKPLQASYTSTPVSEYLGSHIYALAGLPTQHTVMGTYDGRSVVACRDFIESRPDAENVTLVEFKKLENSFLGSSTAGGRTPILGNLLGIFSEHDSLEGIREAAEERYWQMFAVDSLIGNFDRHAGNWGYILDKGRNEIIDLAPIYDCGSSLYPALNEAAMADFIKDRDSLVKRVLDFPRAALRIGKNKVAYHEFLLSDVGAKARAVLGGIMRELDFAAIHRLINAKLIPKLLADSINLFAVIPRRQQHALHFIQVGTPPRPVSPHLRGHLARRYLHVGLLSNRESYLPSLSIA